MKSFNLKKEAIQKGYTTYNKMLEQKNIEMNFSYPDVNTEINLDENNRKNKDNTLLYEGQMNKVRTGTKSVITEAGLETREKIYNDKRLNVWDTPISHVTNVLSEEADQKHLNTFKEAEDADKRDTDFWDKYVGIQLDGDIKKVIDNIQKSQLPNHPDRFKGNNIDKLVMASLRDADAILFHVYAKAKEQYRDLNDDELKLIQNINEAKNKILAVLIQEDVDNLLIRQERDGRFTVNQQGIPIAEFETLGEARDNYPEVDVDYELVQSY